MMIKDVTVLCSDNLLPNGAQKQERDYKQYLFNVLIAVFDGHRGNIGERKPDVKSIKHQANLHETFVFF